MTDQDIIEAVLRSAQSRKLPPPASRASIAEAERVIGHPIPPLLRRLYLEVGNGGFGPRLGVLGVPGEWDGVWRGDWDDIVEVYEDFTSSPEYSLPPSLVWFFDWGCGIWSLIDFSDPDGIMWGWEDGELFPSNMNLAEWIAADLNGNLQVPDSMAPADVALSPDSRV